MVCPVLCVYVCVFVQVCYNSDEHSAVISWRHLCDDKTSQQDQNDSNESESGQANGTKVNISEELLLGLQYTVLSSEGSSESKIVHK